MAESAAHLVDHVFPHQPVRQWVISFPIPLRIMLAAQPQWLTPVRNVIHRSISAFLIMQAGLKISEAQTGAVTLIQRFGSAANLNIHLHCLFLDGIYRLVDGRPVFQSVPPPSEKQLSVLLHSLIQRIMKCRAAEGFLTEEQGEFYMNETEPADPSLTPLQAAACTYRVALGPRAGRKILTVQSAPPQEWANASDRCVSQNGFSFHANTYCAATDRGKLERLCRYDAQGSASVARGRTPKATITRPALANDGSWPSMASPHKYIRVQKRIKVNPNGDFTLKLKSPYRDGTTHCTRMCRCREVQEARERPLHTDVQVP
jgi:hypothetical protein